MKPMAKAKTSSHKGGLERWFKVWIEPSKMRDTRCSISGPYLEGGGGSDLLQNS